MSDLTEHPETLAWKPVIAFSASLLVLSISLNNIGLKSVVDAWAASIAASIEGRSIEKEEFEEFKKESLDKIKQLQEEIDRLKILSHAPAE